jgi:hypothetical protein
MKEINDNTGPYYHAPGNNDILSCIAVHAAKLITAVLLPSFLKLSVI